MTNSEYICENCLEQSKHELTQQGWLCDECNEKQCTECGEIFDVLLEYEG